MDRANGSPCMLCDADDGTTVPAHSNHQCDGKGMGLKAHDLVAHLCRACHDVIDGRTPSDFSPAELDLMFYKAVYKTTVWNLKNGFLKVV